MYKNVIENTSQAFQEDDYKFGRKSPRRVSFNPYVNVTPGPNEKEYQEFSIDV